MADFKPLTFSPSEQEERDRLAAAVTADVLRNAYWKLREHASSYRATNAFRKTYWAWQANRDDSRAYQKHVVHEFYARGVEAAARDIAELLDVPENEIGDGP